MAQIRIEKVTPQLIAAVRTRTAIKEIASAWKPAIYRVKAFLADHPDLQGSGRQVFLYHHPAQRDPAMEIDFGIEVARAFAGEGDVACVSTPEGRVAVAHAGSLRSLPQTHMAIHQWCAANGRAIGGFSWETYIWGDGADPVETIVRYALR